MTSAADAWQWNRSELQAAPTVDIGVKKLANGNEIPYSLAIKQTWQNVASYSVSTYQMR